MKDKGDALRRCRCGARGRVGEDQGLHGELSFFEQAAAPRLDFAFRRGTRYRLSDQVLANAKDGVPRTHCRSRFSKPSSKED